MSSLFSATPFENVLVRVFYCCIVSRGAHNDWCRHIDEGVSAWSHPQGTSVPNARKSAALDRRDCTTFSSFETTVTSGWVGFSASRTRERAAAAILVTSGCYCTACSRAGDSPRYYCQHCSTLTVEVIHRKGAAATGCSVACLFDGRHNKDFQNIIITRES